MNMCVTGGVDVETDVSLDGRYLISYCTTALSDDLLSLVASAGNFSAQYRLLFQTQMSNLNTQIGVTLPQAAATAWSTWKVVRDVFVTSVIAGTTVEMAQSWLLR